jgi:carbamoyltransferase
MIKWGISGNSHDAAIAVFDGSRLLFASQSERFSRKKNDPDLSQDMINYIITKWGKPKEVFWYENPYFKTLRQLIAGQGFNYKKNNIKRYLSNYGINVPITYVDHHLSHAAATYYTAPFDDTAVLVIDSIGEFTTTSIWKGKDGDLKRVWQKNYPDSLGLFYSAMTQRIGLSPQEDEYILMGMAAYGNKDKLEDLIKSDFFYNDKLKVNLHRGCIGWRPELNGIQDIFDIAAATQSIYEHEFVNLLNKAKELTGSRKIALAGGCALNCVSNVKAWDIYDDVWVFPNPGDAGSSVGAVLANTKKKIKWKDCYLGYNINGEYPVKAVLKDLLTGIPVGVANGRAEFGPRALGNRSLLADPRSEKIKVSVNDIKRRQQFRPFAPAVLEEFADDYFDLSFNTSRFMQYAVACKNPSLLPAVVHADGTSRVQTVPPNNTGFRLLLEEWYKATGCPVLLNTSLNIKGQPIANDSRDASAFSMFYNVPVHCYQK